MRHLAANTGCFPGCSNWASRPRRCLRRSRPRPAWRCWQQAPDGQEPGPAGRQARGGHSGCRSGGEGARSGEGDRLGGGLMAERASAARGGAPPFLPCQPDHQGVQRRQCQHRRRSGERPAVQLIRHEDRKDRDGQRIGGRHAPRQQRRHRQLQQPVAEQIGRIELLAAGIQVTQRRQQPAGERVRGVLDQLRLRQPVQPALDPCVGRRARLLPGSRPAPGYSGCVQREVRCHSSLPP